MKTYTLEEAQAQLEQLIQEAQNELVIIQVNDEQQFKLAITPLLPKPKGPRVAGSLRGKIKIADDFDAPLPEFEPYME